jgi:hypothetical protein
LNLITYNGPQPVAYEWFAQREVAGLDSALRSTPSDSAAPHPDRVDDATWRDLDVNAYLKRIAAPASLFARQWLYYRLRTGLEDSAFTGPILAALNDGHANTPALLAATERARQALRSVSTDLTPTLFLGAHTTVSDWVRWLWVAPVIAMLGLILPWSPLAAWSFLTPWLIGGYLLLNGWTQIRLNKALTRWHAQRDAVVALLQAAIDGGRAGAATGHAVLDPLTQALPQHQRLMAQLSPTWMERTPVVAEYANLLALHQYTQLADDVAGLQKHLPALRAAYLQVAQAEAQLCLLEHLQAQPSACAARFSSQEFASVAFEVRGMVNPLLDAAQPLDMHLQGSGALLTGQNGVGKSTWLRGLGLNLLAARAFGFCYAQSATVPRLPVWSSIENEDSLATGDSLYMAEMRRAETLLRVASQPQGAVFLIDEIFRGTNNAESVAAAAAVLSHLAHKALVIVSTHNVVLAPLLQTQLKPLRLVKDNNTLELEPGVLVHTNGLKMMENYDFPASVRDVAGRVHQWFAGYVAEPDNYPAL